MTRLEELRRKEQDGSLNLEEEQELARLEEQEEGTEDEQGTTQPGKDNQSN